MSVYTLSYFGLRGFGDCCRLLLNHLKTDFKDEHVEDWDERQPNTPFGKIPVLTLKNGTQIGDSIAICRYLGKKHGLACDDIEEEAKLDAIVYATKDLVYEDFTQIFFQTKDDAEQIELVKDGRAGLPDRYGFINRRLAASKSGFILDSVKWADFVLYGYWNLLRGLLHTDLSPVPGIKRHYDTVNSLSSVKAFMKKTKDVPTLPFKVPEC